MQITVKNLGAIRQAQFELGDMTIICGGNNTGKTYATYALFGFLSFWRDTLKVPVATDVIESLLKDGSAELDIQSYVVQAQRFVNDGCRSYTRILSKVFASSEKYFSASEFSISIGEKGVEPAETYEKTIGTAKDSLFRISKQADDLKLHISLLIDKSKVRVPRSAVEEMISEAVEEIVFGNLFPKPFIASAERTGAAIFRKELNFSRNRLLEEIGTIKTEINPFEIISKVYSDYALPVKSNVDFTRQLESLAKQESFVAKQHPEILADFFDIIGGDYQVTRNDELYYVPKGAKVKLTMDESSSAVRSLLDIGFYLRHVAAKGDLLIVDEPELNLHPANQRRVARLFSRLVQVGIKVFITTHSDYIIKELNTLILLNQSDSRLQKLAEREGYRVDELLDYRRVRVYIAEEAKVMLDGGKKRVTCKTLVPAHVDSQAGIEARSFDETIEDMNRIQDEIVWGGDA
ncbi:TPA: AAA family ATPase [Pseudomonas aeruginosa]|nr:AAA family ATPase [Pseudomonas aeruginosa]HBO4010633.1 AAA family ATPase [Pseudomonas aeruginosa]